MNAFYFLSVVVLLSVIYFDPILNQMDDGWNWNNAPQRAEQDAGTSQYNWENLPEPQASWYEDDGTRDPGSGKGLWPRSQGSYSDHAPNSLPDCPDGYEWKSRQYEKDSEL